MPGDLEGADQKQSLVLTLGKPRYALSLSTVERLAERWRAAAAWFLSPLQNGEVA